MKITSRQYAKSLIEVMKKVPQNQRERCLDNFVKILESNNDLKIFPFIAEEIKKIFQSESGVKEATVITAEEISADLKEVIVQKLESTFKNKFKLNQKTNPDILGGAIIEFENEVMDGSTRAWINRLRRVLS